MECNCNWESSVLALNDVVVKLSEMVTMNHREVAKTKTDLRKLEKKYKEGKEDSQNFRLSVATVKDLQKLKPYLRSLEESYDKREEEIQSIKVDVSKLLETLNEWDQGFENLRMTAVPFSELQNELKKLEEKCDDKQGTTKSFRKQMRNIEVHLRKLDENCDNRSKNFDSFEADLTVQQKESNERPKDSQFIQTIAISKEGGCTEADLPKKLEEKCDERPEDSQTQNIPTDQVNSIEEMVTEMSATIQTTVKDANEKSKSFGDQTYIPSNFGHEETTLIRSILQIYPEDFFIFHPFCLDFKVMKTPEDILTANSWLLHVFPHKRFDSFKKYLEALLSYYDCVMDYYQKYKYDIYYRTVLTKNIK